MAFEEDEGAVTALLDRARAGCPEAREEALERVYSALRVQAAALLRRERPGHSLGATAVVHEALIKLLRGEVLQKVAGRRELFEVAAAFMRYVLVTHARARKAAKRGGGVPVLRLDESLDVVAAGSGVDAEALLEALERFTARHPRAGQVVTLRFFFELPMPQVAERLGVSLSTAESDFRLARAWLRRELEREGGA